MTYLLYRTQRTRAEVAKAGGIGDNLACIIESMQANDFDRESLFTDRMHELKPYVLERVLSGCGETYPGMPTRDFLKVAERIGFETAGRYHGDTTGKRLLGRRRDATLIALSVAAGQVTIARAAVMYRSSFEGFRHARSYVRDVTDAMESRLALMDDAPERKLAFWCAKPTEPRSPDGDRRFLALSDDRGRLSQTEAFVCLLEKEGARFAPEWAAILDLDRSRTLAEAVALTEKVGPSSGTG